MTTDAELAIAFRTAADPGTRHGDFEAAPTKLLRAPAYLRAALAEHHLRVFGDLAPDRLFEVSRLLSPLGPSKADDPLGPACLAAFLREHAGVSADTRLPTTRRAQAFALLLARLDRFTQIPPDGVAWLFSVEHDWMDQNLYVELEKWCLAQAHIPAVIVELVATLRQDEDNSPPLDRTAVLVAPDEGSLIDLAVWAHGAGRLSEAWRLAARRWAEEGLAPHDDALATAATTIDDAVRLNGRLHVADAPRMRATRATSSLQA